MKCTFGLLLLLSITISAESAQATDADFRRYFAHPDVQIAMDFGKDVGHSQTIPFENHTNPTVESEKPVFQGGWQMSGSRPDNPSIQWKFVKKTDAGDLYVFDVYQYKKLKREFSLVYDGATSVVYKRDGIVISFEHRGG